MTFAVRFALPLSVALVACGGRPPLGSEETPDAGHEGLPPTVDGGDATESPDSSTGTCVDIVLTAADYACDTDSDCQYGSGGTVCDGDCDCPTGSVNAQGQAAISAALSQLTLRGCGCGIGGEPKCVGHVCMVCPFGEDGEPSCPGSDAGLDAEPDVIISPPFDPDGGGTCVDVDLSTYSTSCQTANDCIIIQSGEVCDGDCACSGPAVSASEEARYDAAVSSITFGDCDCYDSPPPECIGGQCVECFGPNEPPACMTK